MAGIFKQYCYLPFDSTRMNRKQLLMVTLFQCLSPDQIFSIYNSLLLVWRHCIFHPCTIKSYKQGGVALFKYARQNSTAQTKEQTYIFMRTLRYYSFYYVSCFLVPRQTGCTMAFLGWLLNSWLYCIEKKELGMAYHVP